MRGTLSFTAISRLGGRITLSAAVLKHRIITSFLRRAGDHGKQLVGPGSWPPSWSRKVASLTHTVVVKRAPAGHDQQRDGGAIATGSVRDASSISEAIACRCYRRGADIWETRQRMTA